MLYSFDLSRTIADLLRAEHEGELHEILARSTRDLGFDRFAMGHHVDLLVPPDDVVRLTNYDERWIMRSLGEGYFLEDPVHRASTQTAIGFLWSEVASMIRLSERQKRILEKARDYGLVVGFTVPVHVPGEYRGTCSFAARSWERVRKNALPIATILGVYAFEAARRIVRRRRFLPFSLELVPHLTDRQRDALVLVARGKADSEIGILLGISSNTAHEHVENVRRAYGYAQRPHLIARALFDGQISYGEVLRS